MTVLLDVDGDHERLKAELDRTPEVIEAEIRSVAGKWAAVLAPIRPQAAPLIREVFGTLTQAGLVVVKPVIYRDGQVHANLVGEPAALQTTVENLPRAVDVTVHEIGEYDGGPRDVGATLSGRQREAIRAALDLGYYDVPRAVTHRDVAVCLGCAESTASEHLQKAEAKVIRSALDHP